MFTKVKWVAGLATLATVGALCGVALAVGFAEVKLTVPTHPVPANRAPEVSVKGHASKRAELALWVSREPCKATAELETALTKGKRLAGPTLRRVDGDFSYHFSYLVNKGKHYACAYVYENLKHTLASDERSWEQL